MRRIDGGINTTIVNPYFQPSNEQEAAYVSRQNHDKSVERKIENNDKGAAGGYGGRGAAFSQMLNEYSTTLP